MVSFSDHLCVSVTLEISTDLQIARPRWRLNVSLLDILSVKNSFKIIWSYLLQKKQMYPNVILWWEQMAKPQIKKFYMIQGKEQKQLKQGLIK